MWLNCIIFEDNLSSHYKYHRNRNFASLHRASRLIQTLTPYSRATHVQWPILSYQNEKTQTII